MLRSNFLRLGALAAALALSTVTALAQSPVRVEKTFDTTLYPRIAISNLRGQVVVRGWEKSQVRLVALTPSPKVEVDVVRQPPTGAADRLQLTTHVLDPALTATEDFADYTLDVPYGAIVEIRNRQGGVDVAGLRGDTWIETTAAEILGKDIAGHLTAKSLGGDIRIAAASGRVEVASITGSIYITSPASSHLRANTNSGAIRYQGDFLAGGQYVLTTYSGNIEILCPVDSSFDLTAKTVKGKLENTLALTPRRQPSTPIVGTQSLLGTHNTGSASVEVSSFSGTIRVRPAR
jgi:hypothetical protein